MKNIIFITTLFFVSSSIFAQWEYGSGGNDFDGKYKYAYIIGKGDKFPYTKPMLTINYFESGSMNIYLSNIGYTGCERNTIRISFGDGNIYMVDDPQTGSGNESLFITYLDNITTNDFIKEIKSKSKISIRHSSSCDLRDFEFSLSGSTKALNYVLKDYYLKHDQSDNRLVDRLEKIKSLYTNIECGKLNFLNPLLVLDFHQGTELFQAKGEKVQISKGSQVSLYRNNDKDFPIEVLVTNGSIVDFEVDLEGLKLITDNIDVIQHCKSTKEHLEKCF